MQRVIDAERAHKEAERVWHEAREQSETVWKTAEAVAKREFNEAIAPFLKIYNIAWAKAFKEAQNRAIEIGATLGAYEHQCWNELFQAREALRDGK